MPAPGVESMEKERDPGCEARVPPDCTSGFCQSHCNSRRCQVHMNRSRCSTAECDSPPAPGCLALVWRIVTIGSVHVRGWAAVGTPEEATFCRTYAGILHAMNASTQNAVLVGAPSTAPADHVRSIRPQTAGGRQSGERWTPQSPQVNLFVWLLSMHAACDNVTNPSMTDSECSQTFFLRITLASFAFRRCSLAISRRYPLISHTHTMVLSVPEDEKHHFWFVQACVVLLSREWRIQPVLGGGCSTMLGASVHTMLLMQGCQRRPVSAFGGILSLLLSECRMQSAFQWSSPETPTCGILTSTSLDPDRAMCLSSLLWICSWFLADWSCAISLIEQPTSRGAGLECIFISSGHDVDVVVRDGLQCCTGSPVCCPVLGSDHFLCDAQLVCLFPHVQTQCMDQRCRHYVIGDPL